MVSERLIVIFLKTHTDSWTGKYSLYTYIRIVAFAKETVLQSMLIFHHV